MPIVATKNPVFSEFLVDTLDPQIMNFGVATAVVNLAAEATITWGDVLIPNATTGATSWRQFVDADDISTIVDSPMPDDAPIVIVIGDGSGMGRGYETTVPATTDTNFTVLFRGPCKFKGDKLAYGDAVADDSDVRTQLEKQKIQLVDVAPLLNTDFHA